MRAVESDKESRLMEEFVNKSPAVLRLSALGWRGKPKGRVRNGRGFDVMKRKIWWAGLGLMGCCWAGAVAGAEPAEASPAFTLEECIDLARRQAAAALNARRDEQIAGTRIGQVRAQALPELTAKGSYTRLDEVAAFEFDGQSFEMGREDNWAASLEASQLLYSGGSVGEALKAAKLYRAAAQARMQAVDNELVRDVRVGFHDILLADEQVRVQEASLAQLEDLLKQAESRFRQQTVAEFDVLSARVRVANHRPLVIAARKQAELARAAFRNLVQLDAAEFALRGELAFAPDGRPLADWLAHGAENRPELVEMRKYLGMRAADVRAEKGGYLPQIRAFANYAGNNPESGTARDEWEWGWNAGITAEWAVFDGLLTRSRVREKQLDLDKARETLADAERQVALEIQTHYLELQQAAETVAASRETVELAEKSLAIARARYENGLATALDYADANLALSVARLTRLQALHDHLNALARLQQASGETFAAGETK